MRKTDAVIQKIDMLLNDKESMTTRTGLSFMTSVMRDALSVIGEIAEKNENVSTRLEEIDRSFLLFMKQQTKKEADAEEERKKWRWVIIAPLVGIFLTEIARLILN